MPPTPVAIALGSNVGDRAAHLAFAVAELSRILPDLRLSRLVDTEPVGVPDAQSRFLNAAVVGTTVLEPGTLLAELLAIERLRGRERPYHHAPRTLDLDLILYGGANRAGGRAGGAAPTIPRTALRARAARGDRW